MEEFVGKVKRVSIAIFGKRLAGIVGGTVRDSLAAAIMITAFSQLTRLANYQLDSIDPENIHYARLRELIHESHQGLIFLALYLVAILGLWHLIESFLHEE